MSSPAQSNVHSSQQSNTLFKQRYNLPCKTCKYATHRRTAGILCKRSPCANTRSAACRHFATAFCKNAEKPIELTDLCWTHHACECINIPSTHLIVIHPFPNQICISIFGLVTHFAIGGRTLLCISSFGLWRHGLPLCATAIRKLGPLRGLGGRSVGLSHS